MLGGHVRLKPNGVLNREMPSLQEIMYKYVSNNLYVLCDESIDTNEWMLRSDVVIPNEICDTLVKYHQESQQDLNDRFMMVFEDVQRTPLKYVALRNSTITDDGMELLLRHRLVSLSMWYCYSVTSRCWEDIIKFGQNLKYLEFGCDVDILKHREPNEKTPIPFDLDLPRLRRLAINGVVLQASTSFWKLRELTYLDLTSCIFNEFSLNALVYLENLQTLILFNVWPLEHEIPNICNLKKLHTLDISGPSSNNQAQYKEPNEKLAAIVESLPLLTHLDISGTNLAGNGVAKYVAKLGSETSDIPGLVSRANNHLQFLGLYNTAHSACRRYHIPAIKIAGEANEEQILTSAVAYLDRPSMLAKVLNDLYHLLRFDSCKSVHRALEVVLAAMDRHLKVKHMQISGSATLFYIVKATDRKKLGTTLKRHIIHSLLNGMTWHMSDDTMMRNGCLTLCQFSIPGDVLFEYERLVKILLYGVSKSEQEGFVQRIAIYLLNSLACQVDGQQKLFLGNLGAVTTMLNLINDRLMRKVFDDVIEVAWSTMWNVTDETAKNCERFLDGEGMNYFLGCLKTFPEREELLRNMMGLLGNVAEVKDLRHRLMSQEFIRVFADLLDSHSDGIEVSYNAAGVLAHIASDGPEAWTIESPTREEVLSKMASAVDRWDLNSERNINYRSFEPIFGLVRCYETQVCQLWAVWALANLTRVYSSKYCALIESENGLELLTSLVKNETTWPKIRDLARMVIEQCDNIRNNDMIIEVMLEG